MPETVKQRASTVKSSGVVGVKRSGAVQVDWTKAVKSRYFRNEIQMMEKIRELSLGK